MQKNNEEERIVDLHIHSHYSRATSKNMNIESLYRWGKIKGIEIMGTGDFTHPQWFAELRNKLEPAEPGLFKLKSQYAQEQDGLIPESCKQNLMRFVLTVEISNIYSKNGSVRKLHNLIVVPNFESASRINAQLSRIGNLRADGRPILGMDSKNLLKITLEADQDALFIPAHIWTPWFAMFGSNSGFDSIEEAFGELSSHIHAVETGLSSDPFMNWRLSQLDKITLVSNSDAHSPQKLAREANIIKSKLDYYDIVNGLKTNDERIVGTVEFFPEEGKYHYDGHRLCGVRCTPLETEKYNGLCPVCKRPLVVGVQNRVNKLADRPSDYRPKTHKLVEYIIPLVEILSEIKNVKSTGSKAVEAEYEKVISEHGSEFDILRKVPVDDLHHNGFTQLAHALAKMRKGDVHVEPGYDCVFGTVKVFGEEKSENEQLKLI